MKKTRPAVMVRWCLTLVLGFVILAILGNYKPEPPVSSLEKRPVPVSEKIGQPEVSINSTVSVTGSARAEFEK